MKSITMRIVKPKVVGVGLFSTCRRGEKRSGSKVNLLASAAASAAAAFLGPSPRDASHCLEFDTQVAELASRPYIHTVVLEG